MAKFPALTFTTKGAQMLIQAMDSHTLTFTHGKLGSGLIGDRDIKALTDLISPKMTLPVVSVDDSNPEKIKLTFNASNTGLDEGFISRELGIFAKLDDGPETLYAYSNAGNDYDYIPSKDTPTDENRLVVSIVVSSSANIKVASDSSITYATKEEVEKQVKTHNDAADAHKALFDKKQDKLTFDTVPTRGSRNPVTSGAVFTELSKKQGSLTFDETPTAGSKNPVTSGGILTALNGKISDGDKDLWDYLHRKDDNFPMPTTNTALNALGMFISYYTQQVLKNQPSTYGQLINIPASLQDESTQLWLEQDSGRMYHRGGNSNDAINNQSFIRFLDENDLNSTGIVAGDVSNPDAWWVKLGGTIPLIIQGGLSGSPVTFPIAFSSLLCILTNVYDNQGGDVGWYEWQVTNCTTTGFSFDKPGIRRYWLALGISSQR